MKILFFILLYGYGLVMGGSSLVFFHEEKLPLWLTLVNCLSAFVLCLTPLSRKFLYLGLALLLFSAILNGFSLNGLPNWHHVVVRLVFSALLCLLYLKQIKPD
ncbi:hypothetical protein BAU15_09405 [Enterococcus sp. JM4C]|nr:hypothetical protein BAU15_09405 [Enterococcus sp. JM4C]